MTDTDQFPEEAKPFADLIMGDTDEERLAVAEAIARRVRQAQAGMTPEPAPDVRSRAAEALAAGDFGAFMAAKDELARLPIADTTEPEPSPESGSDVEAEANKAIAARDFYAWLRLRGGVR